jgi:hypothetical protein
MYRINYAGRPTLIVPEEVHEKIAADKTADVRMLQQNIEVAEERIVVDALGNALYEELLEAKNRIVTEANQVDLLAKMNAALTLTGQPAIESRNLPIGTLVNASEFLNTAQLALWNRYLWRITAEAVDLMCTVPSWLRFTNQGQQQNNPKVIGGNGESSASGDRGDVKFKMDVQLQQRISPLVDRMQGWMRTNGTHTFLGWEPACVTQDKPRRNTGGFILGIYDNVHGSGCGCRKCERRGGGW